MPLAATVLVFALGDDGSNLAPSSDFGFLPLFSLIASRRSCSTTGAMTAARALRRLAASTVADLQALAAGDARLTEALDAAMQRPAGGDHRSESYRETIVDDIHSGSERPSGTSEAAALRRLRKHRPDLLARVLDGELSAVSG